MAVRAPSELAWLVEPIGAEAALALIEWRGGTRLYVPQTVSHANELTRIVGLPAARALAAAFGGDTVTVPVARAWRARHYRAAGLSQAAIARKLGCHEDTVWRLLRTADETPQLSLPI